MKDSSLEKIYVSKVKTTQDVPYAVKAGISSISDFELCTDSKVVIKPNLCCVRSHETGATTDPGVVEAIIKYLRTEYGIKDISLVESDGTQVLADMAFQLLGYKRLSKKLDVKLLNLSKSPCSIRSFAENTFLKEIRVPDIIESADCFISVPKIKTHDFCTLTAALKNQYGCNPYPNKSIYHSRIHEAIVDLNVAFRADLTIVDGIVAMEGHRGPVDGPPVKMGIMIFGKDPVAVDHFIARVMGINPDSVKYLVMAERRGIGCSTYETVGTELKQIRRKFRIKPPTRHNMYGLLDQWLGES
jgi:uncharacterized protein (DUF362 family)